MLVLRSNTRKDTTMVWLVIVMDHADKLKVMAGPGWNRRGQRGSVVPVLGGRGGGGGLKLLVVHVLDLLVPGIADDVRLCWRSDNCR